MKQPRYRRLNHHLVEIFGEKVYKVGLYGGFTCPNRDGTKGRGGCVFCNPAATEPRALESDMRLNAQLDRGVRYLADRHDNHKFIAYFQDYTTTWGDVNRLESLCREAIAFPGIVGLALCTRPDCLPEPVLDLLQQLATETFLWVEVGVQTIHDSTLQLLNRCHTAADSDQALSSLRERSIPAVGHIILGLPGESATDMLATAGFLRECGVQGAKIHNLQVYRQTPLARWYADGRYTPMEQDEYVERVIDFLEQLPAEVVIQRLCGDAPHRFTVAPEWSRNKLRAVNAIEKELTRRDTWQGKALGAGRMDVLRTINARN